MFNKEKIDSLEQQLMYDKERIYELEQKMFALQRLLDLSFTPKIVKVTKTIVGTLHLDSDVQIEPAKFTFINRFPEKVKESKSKKVTNKKKK